MANPMKAPYPPTATTVGKAHIDPSTVVFVAPAADRDTCECTAGWWLFGLGWWLTPIWAAGACMPLCDKGSRLNVRRNNRRAAIGSAVMLVLSIIALVVVVVMMTRTGVRWSTTTRYIRSGSPGIVNPRVNRGNTPVFNPTPVRNTITPPFGSQDLRGTSVRDTITPQFGWRDFKPQPQPL